ncbi:alpha/beta fold hydrolase [Sphingomonas psychrotolerans]|uniref:Alpha/beta hydrolase n=1 Tax=Sphingomonas psychrotolerans TaxID=1327635 RepID=A0A2K8MES8_9SPHN|nr:alpha/beta hydrolase [Sphingomonas psychrotolerans]ATY32363.1 alpha/beta hydrolase [Sphingomonas psychrotolerans]
MAAESFSVTPNRTITVDGTSFAYRDMGPRTGIPILLLNHLGATLDNFDPRIVDGLAQHHRVVAFDNRGIGASGGSTSRDVAAMARDVVAFIHALGLPQVDLFGFSLGGFVAQQVALDAPALVRRMILTGTGPAGGVGMDKVTGITLRAMLKGALTLQDPKVYLFFTRTPNGRRAARDFIARLKERKADRDKPLALPSFGRQLTAIKRWARQAPQDLSVITHPTFVANGDDDLMVPTENSRDLARRIPGARLVIYDDAGHGGIFQHHKAFVPAALDFLR